MGIWDSNLKQLVTAHPQDFVTWLLEGAIVTHELSEHLNRAIDIDILYATRFQDQDVAVHIEFQRYRDPEMAERVWEYNVLATRKYGYNIVSYVIYLKQDGKGIVPESPLVKKLSHRHEIHRFHFVNIKLWEIPTEDLRKLGLMGLLPLLPLTRDGASQEVVEEVVETVTNTVDKDDQGSLLSITFTLASLVFQQSLDSQQWLIRRFKMFQDILRDTPIYQYIMQEGKEEGLQEGLQEGAIAQAKKFLLRILQKKFPELTTFATKQIADITDVELLEDLTEDISSAQTTEDAKALLIKATGKL